MLSICDDELHKQRDDGLSKCRHKMQMDRFKIFERQDLETGRFDVTFEIEGKKLHAHTFILTSVSETMDVWLTDRWTTKDTVIKVENYPYACFYEFLRFLYTSE
uniref:BTB domain-containing protein n=1 Tax=Panagrolaimus sp. ES5 TaxID=591445 RepID=A0AC34GGT5_9BILA